MTCKLMKSKSLNHFITLFALTLSLAACAAKNDQGVEESVTSGMELNEKSESTQDVFTEYAARCVAEGRDMETSRVYSLHLEDSSSKAILVAVDTDKLMEVVYGDVLKKGNVITFKNANATFTKATDDAGGSAIINGEKFFCDFSQQSVLAQEQIICPNCPAMGLLVKQPKNN